MSERAKRKSGKAKGSKPAVPGTTRRQAPHVKAAQAARGDADAYRAHLLDRLHRTPVKFEQMGAKMALAELKAFAETVFTYPRMQGYFDPKHLTDLRSFPELAEIAAKPLSIGGTVEIIALPVTRDRTQGFHIFRVYEDGTGDPHGVIVGYLIHSMELGGRGRQGAATVRLAYDIFPPYRHRAYEPVPFSSHEVYNVSRAAFLKWRPERFYVDARTQIKQTVTGDPVLRAGYYLKRGYYPADQKPLADRLLTKLLKRGRGSRLTPREFNDLFQKAKEPGWIYPVE